MFNLNIMMGFKTITIKTTVYKELAKIKQSDESFSDLFGRLMGEKRVNLMDFAGAWNLTEKDFSDTKRRMAEHRKRFNEDFDKRLGK